MTLRIEILTGANVRTIVLRGRLSAAETAELERTAADAGLPLRIDLGQLKRSGASLVGASPYVGMLLANDETVR